MKLRSLRAIITNDIVNFIEGMDMEYSPDSPVVNDYNYLVPQSSLPDLLQTIFNRFEEFDDE